MLDGALSDLQAEEMGEPTPPLSARIVRLPATSTPVRPIDHLCWLDDLAVQDPSSGYETRLDLAVLDSMRELAVWAARNRSPGCEIGGLLFGQFDSASRIVWVNSADGPPADSTASEGHFRLGIDGVSDRIAHYRDTSNGTLDLVGIWHTHPYGSPQLSDIDQAAMDELLKAEDKRRSQALIVVLGGLQGQWQEWLDGTGRPDIVARVILQAIPDITAPLRDFRPR